MKTWRMIWVTVLLFAGGGLLLAEDITLTTFYPSPRGVYNELRTSGDVHIGDVTAPTARLHVEQADAADAFRVDDETGDLTPFVIDQSGIVGIGMETPLSKLHIVSETGGAGGLDQDIMIEATGANTWASIGLKPATGSIDRGTIEFIATDDSVAATIAALPNAGTPLFFIATVAGGQLYLDTGGGGSFDLVVDGAGNVGINAPTPGQRLHVNGTVRLEGLTDPGGPRSFLCVTGTGVVSVRAALCTDP